ncbi:MAG: hypothetical protein PHC51_06390 [bacterium]|nr:hypothetical protein [bacterium]
MTEDIAEVIVEQNDAEQEREELPPIAADMQTVRFILLVLSLAVYLFFPVFSPEFFGHLARGRWILTVGDFPWSDHWTEAGSAFSWYDSSWLFDVTAFWLVDNFGEPGVGGMKAAVWLIFTLFTGYSFASLAGSRTTGFLLACLLCPAVLADQALRPDILGVALMISSLALQTVYFRNPLLSWPLAVFFLLSIVACNTHSSAILLPVILAAGAVATQPALFASRFWLCFRFIVFWMLSAMASPYFGRQLLTAGASWINELALATALRDQAPSIFHVDFAIFLIVVSLFIQASFESGVLPKSTRVICLLVFGVVSLVMRSTLPWAIAYGCYCFATLYDEAVKEGVLERTETGVLAGINRLGLLLGRLPAPGLEFLALCIVLVNSYNYFLDPMATSMLPRSEVFYMQSQKMPGPLYHPESVGGYLQWELGEVKNGDDDELRAEFDERTRGINPRFAGSAALILDLKPGWDEALYSLQPRTMLLRTTDPLYQILVRDPQWQLRMEHGKPVDIQADDSPEGEERSDVGWAVFTQKTDVGEPKMGGE